ncbi:hypothetical protein GF360_02680 [candidate division WWE3 bacterium]|nr:hypothetical protein [candidate division WWE3 bacterium]
MKKAFLIHGAYGNPQENWFPWLKEKLEQHNYKVITPTFPTPENQTLKNWNDVFDKYKEQLDEETILIGHSLGCPYILNVLQDIDKKVKAAYLVAAFHKALGHSIDEINETFVEKDFDWSAIKRNCENIVMFSSDNDPYIPMEVSEELAQNLDADFNVVADGGHLNSTAGYTEFEELLKKLEDLFV